jgi:hypothetical protein
MKQAFSLILIFFKAGNSATRMLPMKQDPVSLLAPLKVKNIRVFL